MQKMGDEKLNSKYDNSTHSPSPAGVQHESNTEDSNEHADIIAGMSNTATGVVVLARRGLKRIEFSVVNDRAIFEGDIELGVPGELESNEKALAASAGEMQAAIVSDASRLWPLGLVPYDPLPDSSPIKNIVIMAMENISIHTAIQFIPRQSSDNDYVAFEVSAFCSSRVGRTGGRQVIRLSSKASVGNAIHEMCHLLGMWHEQSREDRDNYMRVLWENILPGYEHNFRQQITDGDDIGPYNIGSIMHYPPNAFSKNGEPTLQALSGNTTFGQRNGLSNLDIAAIQHLYPLSNENGRVIPNIDDRVQFQVTLAAFQTARIITTDWPTAQIVHWDIVCVNGPIGTGPLVTWTYSIGRTDANHLDYFFTITNLVDQSVIAEARYSLLD